MEFKSEWQSTDFNQEQIILAGDVGGTNTNLAIVGKKGSKYTIMLKCNAKSSSVTDFIEPLQETIKIATQKKSDLKINFCCISAAGPVDNNYCKLTNCSWAVDGAAIEKKLGVKTLIINDFLAIGYGIPTLDVNNPSQIGKLKNTTGVCPEPKGTTIAVVGAGTGLGVGFLTARDGIYTAYPSEGGHSGFTAFDQETKELLEYVSPKFKTAPGTEPFVSGQGIVNAFYYYRDVKKIPMTGVLKEINEAKDEDKPKLISMNSDTNPTCKQILQLFVKMNGKFAGDVAILFMATAGLYLAGGIVTKDEKHFTTDNLFMKYFEMNYNPNIEPLLKKIPVYIIKDYSISLYGAANAGFTLIK